MKLSSNKPEKSLIELLPKHSGRDNSGHVAMRHQGGRHKRYYRIIDWKRDKEGVTGRVVRFEFDPNRSAHIALIQYHDGEKRYILKPEGLHEEDTIVSGKTAEVRVGNTLLIGDIPVGTPIHALELIPGKGAKLVRGAGNVATILSKEGRFAQVKLPSGEIRLIDQLCKATIGQLGNISWNTRIIGTAGRSRHLGIRPTVRGTAQNPRSHPHGGGEGRSGIGMKAAKSQWGKRTRGVRTRNKKKSTNRFIIKRRK